MNVNQFTLPTPACKRCITLRRPSAKSSPEKDLKIENPAYGDFTNLLITQRDPDEIVLESHDSPDEAKAKAATKRPAATAKKMAAPKSKGKGKGKKATKAAVEEDENAPVDVMA